MLLKKNEEYKNKINELENIIKELKNQLKEKYKLLKEEKIKNVILNAENDNLDKNVKEKDKLLKEEKRKNDNLNVENDNLNKTIKEKDKLLKDENLKDESLNKKIKEFEIISNKTKINITELENEIKLYRTYYNFSPNEKLISIKFISINQDIDFTIIIKNSDKFSKIENILYDKYPKYKDSENYFLVNGNKINKYRTFEENKIRNNDVLTLEINNFD